MASRRTLLKAGAAGVGLAAFAAGYEETARHLVAGVVDSLEAKSGPPNINGHSLPPEAVVDPATGAVRPNPGQYVANAACLGCTTLCGVRVRVDRASGQVLRVVGNPYHPLSAEPHLPYATPLKEAAAALSRAHESGLARRATVCGRGAAALEMLTNKQRVTVPLKRVGPRNSGRWQPISAAQLVHEIVEGGDLFGEGHVDGLRAIHSRDPIDPARPDLGPRANQLGLLFSLDDGRVGLLQRFVQHGFGSINLISHGSHCGGNYRAGAGAVFGDTKTQPHARPDLPNAEFVIFCGTAPAQAGNPFKRMGWQVAEGRDSGRLNYVVIDPVLGQSDNIAAKAAARWVPIRPATDGALAMAMIGWILANNRHNANYLSRPSAEAAKAAGEAGFCDATHLVIDAPGHPRQGFYLRASDLGLAIAGARYGEGDPVIVQDAADGALKPAGTVAEAALFVDRTDTVDGAALRLRSALALLRDSAATQTLEQYAAICGVPGETIVGLARELTAHGRRAGVAVHGGTMAGNGFTAAFALMTLNTLIGNLNWRGGLVGNGPPYPAEGAGPRYDMVHFPGALAPAGTPLSRNVPYERSSEFARKKAAGAAYPAERPWYPTAPQLSTEWLPSALDGEPYGLKALFLVDSNPLYAIPGARAAAAEAMADPKRLPLIVAVNPFVNESAAFADYIVPDTALYETWGWAAAWAGVPTRTTTARWPAVSPPIAAGPDGDPFGLESFLIACALALGLPGFGAGAIADTQGGRHPLQRAADWFLRGGANVAFATPPVADIDEEELALCGLDRLRPDLESVLAAEEWRKVATVLARGGRFADYGSAFVGERAATPMARMLHVYCEPAGVSRNALSGARVSGVPGWLPPAFADGSPMRTHYGEQDWPFLVVSQKSVLLSGYTNSVTRLRGIAPDNPVSINIADAARLGISTGDSVVIETPGGRLVATALVRRGIMPGVVAIPHGYGHRELGARARQEGQRILAALPGSDAGVNLNDLGLADPTRKGLSVWQDPISGTAVRQGLPARLARA